MPFLTAYRFAADTRKAALIGFIAHVPPEQFCFVIPPSGQPLYGLILSDDVMEYFTTEYPVAGLTHLSPSDWQAACGAAGCTVWGNRALLEL
ncbi:MAG: hypothetical protein JWP27_200 [Flaviaesturariibacter sp.]|nr:hypothetical protein [Flaviaesturariibacter sp.]